MTEAAEACELLARDPVMTTEIGPYIIVAQRDDAGHVFEARDRAHGRKVVLTECPEDWSVEEILQALEDNGRAFTLLDNPSLERVIGFARRDQTVYLVTELVEGTTLRQILNERGRMPEAMVVPLFRQILTGMAAAHRVGVVHGELNPDNITIPDFGPAKILNLAFSHAFLSGSPGNASRYVSPERFGGALPDARSDIFSIGVMLHEAIVGKGPFDDYGECDANLAPGQLVPVLPSIAQPELPKWVDQLISRMIAHDPVDRFPSVQAVIRALDSYCKASAESAEALRLETTSRTAARSASTRRKQMEDRSTLRGPATKRSAQPNRLPAARPMRKIGVAALLVLIAAELAYFRGTHGSAVFEAGRAPKPSLNHSADAMFARFSAPTEAIPFRKKEFQRREPAGAQAPEEKSIVNRKLEPPAGNVSVKPAPFDIVAGPKLREEPRVALKPPAPPPKPPETKEPEKTAAPARTAQTLAIVPELKIEWEH